MLIVRTNDSLSPFFSSFFYNNKSGILLSQLNVETFIRNKMFVFPFFGYLKKIVLLSLKKRAGLDEYCFWLLFFFYYFYLFYDVLVLSEMRKKKKD